MLRAMYTSITGLRNHQTMLDVVGNNIANVNTFGFKGSNTAFKTLLAQTMQGAGAPSPALGGTNNIQVGLGMMVDSVRQNFTQGALQTTGSSTDLAIQGDGFFRTVADPATLATGGTISYTRAGNFGWDAGVPGLNPGDPNGPARLVTSDGQFVVGYEHDPLTGQPLMNPGPPPAPVEQQIEFNPLTHNDVLIQPDGRVTAINNATGDRETLAWLSMTRFSNPSGLTQVGNNRWQESMNSGSPVDGTPGLAGMGSVNNGYLEMSNVDLATEFTEMIKAQRGFQANSRVITTSDEILQELVNLKR